MSSTDQDFRDEFKPLHIPAHYMPADSDEDKIIYALAQIEEGTPDDVATEISKHDSAVDLEYFKTKAASVLHILYEKGLIKGSTVGDTTTYNLSKITRANDGAVDPELLAPGLD
ncbi:hypothetical protein [Mucilaginibacter jinjuensis]|uniref:Uncharacterized protein n=1 Tax=Mucilaginibacter jinjuensis TaxID=1176721 RepID=A0ABY7T5R1_9SPHI|nr:hypothetical protein [Mucilaginibacter jinjuensis]WCT11599.1 hypothetical protein PQO05_22930 [Mucilaginibacter jinjuensis]